MLALSQVINGERKQAYTHISFLDEKTRQKVQNDSHAYSTAPVLISGIIAGFSWAKVYGMEVVSSKMPKIISRNVFGLLIFGASYVVWSIPFGKLQQAKILATLHDARSEVPLWNHKEDVKNAQRMFYDLEGKDNSLNILHHGMSPDLVNNFYPNAKLSPDHHKVA